MSTFTGGDPRQIHHLERDAEFLIELPNASGKRGERGLRKVFRAENTVDYYDRERTDEQQ
jgi:hypothetical protein